MTTIILADFPLPPSVNSALMPVMSKIKYNKKGKPYATGRMVKTYEHLGYTSACISWSMGYKNHLAKYKYELLTQRRKSEALKEPFALKVEYFFFMHRSKIITLAGKPEENDVDNRIKPCQDNLFKILNIDDSHVFPVYAEKVSIPDNEKERVIIRISSFKARTGEEITKLLLSGVNPAT